MLWELGMPDMILGHFLYVCFGGLTLLPTGTAWCLFKTPGLNSVPSFRDGGGLNEALTHTGT